MQFQLVLRDHFLRQFFSLDSFVRPQVKSLPRVADMLKHLGQSSSSWDDITRARFILRPYTMT